MASERIYQCLHMGLFGRYPYRLHGSLASLCSQDVHWKMFHQKSRHFIFVRFIEI